MADSRKRLVVIDGHALAYRAFYALQDASLSTSAGEPTYAVFGFMQILLTMLHEQQPEYVAVAFDVGRTFRDDIYAEYKAGRAETPAEFHQQLARIREMVTALNIPVYEQEGYEADDVIGTLAEQATAQGLDTIILTGDTDTLQLVNSHVSVLMANPYGKQTRTTMYDEAGVQEKYDGLRPNQLADLRGLRGDKSDNIPGVKGVGDKTAIPLLNEHGTLENIYSNLELVPDRFRKKLEAQRDEAMLSKQLSIIRCDVPVTLDKAAARLADYDRDRVLALFQQLEFGSSMVQKLPAALERPSGAAQGENVQLDMFAAASGDGAAPALSSSSAREQYRSVTTEEDLRAVLAELAASPGFAFDVESDGLNFDSRIVGLSLAASPGSAWYIPFGHQEGEQLPREQVLAEVGRLLADPDRPKYAHNAKFDMELLHQAGINVAGLALDTMLAAQLLGKRAGLKELAFYELKLAEPMTEIKSLIGSGKKQITFDRVPIAQATPYAAADADMTLRLAHHLEALLGQPAHNKTRQMYAEMEHPLLPVLAQMEMAGITIDTAHMQQLSTRLGERMRELERQIHEAAGEPFNVNSGDQLSKVLFEKLGLPTTGLNKTSTGRFSLTADALERLATTLEEAGEQHDILEYILRYRQLAKLTSTYIDALPKLVNKRTGRIHTSFNQLGAETGRLSSTSPNLQNIPVRTEEGNAIRRGFVAAPGHCFIAADYSQIELRVLAHITQDPHLVQVFQEGRDIHAATAAQLFGMPAAEIDKNQRRIAKTVVFGVIYGISSFGLAQRTELKRDEAQALIDALFAEFPGIRQYIDRTLSFAREHGYVESLFGRRRLMAELKEATSKSARVRAAEREAINAPIQATAADIMKLAMLRLADELTRRELHTRLLLQVHDELILEVPHAEVDTVQQMVRAVMENVMTSDTPLVRAVMESETPFTIPLQVNVSRGSNWEEMEELEP